jgi:dipeptidyl-peptidase-4
MVMRSAHAPGRFRARHTCAVVCLAFLALEPTPAQQTPEVRAPSALTIDDLFSYEGFTKFNGKAVATMNWVPEGGPWIDATHYLWPGGSGDGGWLRVDATSGTSEPLFSSAAIDPSLLKSRPTVFTNRRDAMLLSDGSTLYYSSLAKPGITRLTTSPDAKTEPTFSPNGRFVAFIKNNNLYVTSVGAPSEVALTSDGGTKVLNGVLDWVYSEELYGRGNHRAYWWSPDSSKIAFLQLDDRQVPEYTLVDDIPYHPNLDTWPYPKAGDPNPVARLLVVDINDVVRQGSANAPPKSTTIDTSKYRNSDGFLIVNVGWTPDSRAVAYQLQDRQQSWLDFNTADPQTGRSTTLFRETSETWVERWGDSSADPVWLSDGSFLWLSERTGWRHLYHYRANGTLVRPVTTGQWEVRDTHGTDTSGEWIYFSGTERSPLDLDIYRVRLDGSGLRRLSTVAGTHTPFFSPSHSLFLDTWSNATTPSQVRLHTTDGASPGAVVRVVEANPTTAAQEYRLSKPEFVQVQTGDGFPMEAVMIKPPDFDPARRYPVYQFTYGGPHAPQVLNAWSSNWIEHAFHQLLAQRGAIVWICDNRSASGKGAVSAWPIHKQLGTVELSDIEAGLSWLTRQPFVDASRIGISGVSYGGFMTLYALTHSKRFVMGIAQGAVSDWRNYDSIYTERYLGLPEENPTGYRRSSPRFAAAALSAELLLIHGTADDNVHPQNASQFAFELQKAGRQFQLMMYPHSAHGLNGPDIGPHLRRLMLDFTVRTLKLGTP